jgi:uncharacterized OB-fold protein
MARVAIEPGVLIVPEGDEPPRLCGSRCDACGAVFHPRRPVCLACHGRALTDVDLSGRGRLYAYTRVAMRLRPGRRTEKGYAVAQVDLDDGPRVQGLLAPEVEEPEIGMRLRLGLETLRIDDDGTEVVVHHFHDEGAKS